MKNILYLDEQKLFSLSSQLFEGVTDYIVNESSGSKEESTGQKGKFATGRTMENILRDANKKTELKYLKDHAFDMFESELISNEKVLEIDASSDKTIFDDSGSYSFVKASATVAFNDGEKLRKMMSEFPALQKSLHIMNVSQQVNDLEAEIQVLKTEAGNNKNKIGKLRDGMKELQTVPETLRKEFLDSIIELSKFGYEDQFLTEQEIAGFKITACLDKVHLRESASLIMRKYSRLTSRELVVLGSITQHLGHSAIDNGEAAEDDVSDDLRAAIKNIVKHIAKVERTFTGKYENELVVDPIAVYAEL